MWGNFYKYRENIKSNWAEVGSFSLLFIIITYSSILVYPQIQQMTITMASPILGPFAGVLLAFWINNQHRKNLEHERQLFFKNLLLNEIRRSIQLLEGSHPNLIPIDAWNSLVNSGAVTLFPRDLTIRLSNIYFEIQNYNYEVNWVWQHNFIDLDLPIDNMEALLVYSEMDTRLSKIRFFLDEIGDANVPSGFYNHAIDSGPKKIRRYRDKKGNMHEVPIAYPKLDFDKKKIINLDRKEIKSVEKKRDVNQKMSQYLTAIASQLSEKLKNIEGEINKIQ